MTLKNNEGKKPVELITTTIRVEKLEKLLNNNYLSKLAMADVDET